MLRALAWEKTAAHTLFRMLPRDKKSRHSFGAQRVFPILYSGGGDLSVEGLIAGPVKSPGVPFLHRLFPADLLYAGFEVHALG